MTAHNPRPWRIAGHDEPRVRQVSGALNISFLLAQVLVARGCTSSEDAETFLRSSLMDLHDPELLPGVAEAADRIVSALQAKRRITIYGDYDVDGVTATSLLWHCIQLSGGRVDYYIPDRLEEGYGLNCDALKQLHTDDPERLVISVDCGISSVEETQLAKQLGLELIITDHHQLSDTLPEAAGLVHPRLPGGEYPFGDLCGAGVAFKLAWAICQRLGDGKKASPRMREFLLSAVGLATLGTVADVVPLVDENRVLVRYGLSSLPDRSNPGLKALMESAGLEMQRKLQAEDIAFSLAPRINAAGRLGQARLAVEMLTTEDHDRAKRLAAYLEQLNKDRQKLERRIFKQAKELVAEHPEWNDRGALVLAHPEWHAGVIGIVANRVAEHFERPTLLIALSRQDGLGQGSGRSFAGFDLHAGLAGCSGLLRSFGGHQAAVGLKIQMDKIDSFREEFTRVVETTHRVNPRDRELAVDAEVRLADLTHRAVNELDQLGPFGHKNPRPVFAATNVELSGPPRTMGEGDRHLSLRVQHFGATLRAVAFGRGEWAEELAQVPGPIAIGFAPKINRFRGRESVELELIDWKSAV